MVLVPALMVPAVLSTAMQIHSDLENRNCGALISWFPVGFDKYPSCLWGRRRLQLQSGHCSWRLLQQIDSDKCIKCQSVQLTIQFSLIKGGSNMFLGWLGYIIRSIGVLIGSVCASFRYVNKGNWQLLTFAIIGENEGIGRTGFPLLLLLCCI